jgi:hypothetical protein
MGPRPAVTVSERALLQRINRKLRHYNQRVCKSTPSCHSDWRFGDYYLRGEVGIDDFDVDLEGLGREIGVLAEWERLG